MIDMAVQEHEKTECNDGKQETNRDRVRRLLLDPLGFRFPRGTTDETAKKRLNAIADEMGYLTDDSLRALAALMRSHGDGSSKCFWPPLASFVGLAEYVQKRPIEELPALLSWFRSVEGPRAAAAGELVETYLFIASRKYPPFKDGYRREVALRAAENNRRVQIVEERHRGGLPVAADDDAFVRWYAERQEYCAALLTKIQDQKADQA